MTNEPSPLPLDHAFTPPLRQNRLLRRLDWRFLLPLPPGEMFDHLVLLGARPGLAALCVQVGLAKTVSETVQPAATADGLVLLADTPQPLAEALPVLRPGGVVYRERPRRWSRLVTVSQARRQWRGLGLSAVSVYCAWPDFDAHQMYLPLENPAALRWCFNALPGAFQAGRPRLARVFSLLALLKPSPLIPLFCCAVTAVKASAEHALPSVVARAPLPAAGHAAGWPPLVLTTGKDSLDRLVTFVGRPSHAQPVAVLKAWRLPEQNAVTQAEQALLTTIRAGLDETMRRTIPEPYGAFMWQQLALGAEGCAPGRSLATSGQAGRTLADRITDLRLVADWLARFHAQGQHETHPWGQSDIEEWAEGPLAAYAAHAQPGPATRQLLARVKAAAQQLTGCPIPTVWVHWGFTDRNLFRSAAGLTVSDWEAASPGPPLFDLHYSAIHWYIQARGLRTLAAQGRGVGRLFCEPVGDDRDAAAVHAALMQYRTALQLDARFGPVLLVLHLVERVLGRLKRQGAWPSAPAPMSAYDKYAGFMDALAEGQAQLFGPMDNQAEELSD